MDEISGTGDTLKEISNIMVFLQEKGASSAFAVKIYKQYGAQSIALITENPYRVAEDIWGIGFKTADSIAQNMGFARESIQRIQAGILHTITSETNQGHLYVELEHLKKQACVILELVVHGDTHSTSTNQSNTAHVDGRVSIVDATTSSISSSSILSEETIALRIKQALHQLYNQEKIWAEK